MPSFAPISGAPISGLALADSASPYEADVSAPRYLVELHFDEGTSRYWNGVGNLSALGQTWIGVGRLATMSPIKVSQEIRANGLEFTITIMPTAEVPDAPDTFLNLALSSEYQNRQCIVYQAMLDPDTNELLAEPRVRFSGYLDVMEDSEMPGQAILRVTAENRLITLERAKVRTYTPEDQKLNYPSDTFFDEVAALQNRQVVLKPR